MRRRHRQGPANQNTRATEPQSEAQAANSPRSDGGEKNYSKHEGDELDNTAEQPVGFFGRMRSAVAGWFENWRRPPSPETAMKEPAQDEKLAGYFDQAAHDRVLDGIRHDDAQGREWQQQHVNQQEADSRLQQQRASNEAARQAHYEALKQRDAERGFNLGPMRGSSDEEAEIKAAKLAAWRRHHAEVEESIEQRARSPDRGYERD